MAAGKVVGPFCENAAGDIWVGTRDGLCFFDVSTHQLTAYPIGGGVDKKYDIRSLLLDEGTRPPDRPCEIVQSSAGYSEHNLQ